MFSITSEEFIDYANQSYSMTHNEKAYKNYRINFWTRKGCFWNYNEYKTANFIYYQIYKSSNTDNNICILQGVSYNAEIFESAINLKIEHLESLNIIID